MPRVSERFAQAMRSTRISRDSNMFRVNVRRPSAVWEFGRWGPSPYPSSISRLYALLVHRDGSPSVPCARLSPRSIASSKASPPAYAGDRGVAGGRDRVCCKSPFSVSLGLPSSLSRATVLRVIGKVEFAYGFKQMASPHFEKLDGGRARAGIQPVHRERWRIPGLDASHSVAVALEQCR